MYWPPQEIAQKHLPNLKLAVAATNKTHKRTLEKQSAWDPRNINPEALHGIIGPQHPSL